MMKIIINSEFYFVKILSFVGAAWYSGKKLLLKKRRKKREKISPSFSH